MQSIISQNQEVVSLESDDLYEDKPWKPQTFCGQPILYMGTQNLNLALASALP
jgi:hypothetical protein